MPYDLLKSFPDLLTVRLHLSLSGEKMAAMINSKLQFTALEIAEFVGEPEKMGFWIGVVKTIGIDRAYEIMSPMKQTDIDGRAEPIKSRARLFLFLSKKRCIEYQEATSSITGKRSMRGGHTILLKRLTTPALWISSNTPERRQNEWFPGNPSQDSNCEFTAIE